MARRRVVEEGQIPASAEERTLPLVPADGLDGLSYIKCACGLTASTEVFRKWGGKCDSCGRDVALSAAKGLATPAKPAPVQPEAPKGVASDGKPLCFECGVPITETAAGLFYRCGHGPKAVAMQVKPVATVGVYLSTTKPSVSAVGKKEPMGDESSTTSAKTFTHSAAAVDTFEITWAEETYSPKQFHTYRVGPFTVHGAVGAGETRAQAMERAMRELEQFAEKERVRKRASFVNALKDGF